MEEEEVHRRSRSRSRCGGWGPPWVGLGWGEGLGLGWVRSGEKVKLKFQKSRQHCRFVVVNGEH